MRRPLLTADDFSSGEEARAESNVVKSRLHSLTFPKGF